MYNASAAFHEAVANGAHQIALLIFDDDVFTNDDINVTAGIEFNDYFNMEEDMAIGQALSNEISFSLFNDTGLLNDYELGDFTATIGAKIGEETVSVSGIVNAQSASHTYAAYASSPYLKRDGVAVSSQPGRRITSMVIYNNTVYCRLNNGAIVGYKDSDGSSKSVTVGNHFKALMKSLDGKGVSFVNNILRIWNGTKKKTYEFVPLGKFNAERPNVPYVNEIRFTCYDLMQRFEKDMPSDADLGISYPIPFGSLFRKMCIYADIPYRSTTFINSTAMLTGRPDDFDSATMREVLQWLAEAACSVARIDRDGYLIMDWMRDTDLTINETGYSEFNPYWYQTKKISKLDNRASSGDYEHTLGTGDEVYLIQDNPLLKGVT